MRVLEADLDRIRITVRRPARTEAVVMLLGITTLVLGPVAWLIVVSAELGGVQTELREPAPEAPVCTWETLRTESICSSVAPELLELPSLAQVYVARRAYHRAQLLPDVFDASPPVVAPLPPAFANLIDDDAERRLVGHILREAYANPLADRDGSRTGWVGRDPMLGVPLGSRPPDDDSVLSLARAYAPTHPELPDLDRPVDDLVEDDILRESADRYVVTSDELRAYLADLAARDVVGFAELREAALREAAVAHHEAEVEAHRARQTALSADAAAWKTRRNAGIPVLVASWGLAAALFVPLSWCFRRRLTITMDLHALTLGETRFLWEALDELIWTHRRVTWHVEGGAKGHVGDLDLTDGEVRVLQRTSHAVWLRDRGEPPNTALKAIRQLVESAPRGDD